MSQQSPTLSQQQHLPPRSASFVGSPGATSPAGGGISLPPAKRPRLSPTLTASQHAVSSPSALSLPGTPSGSNSTSFNLPQSHNTLNDGASRPVPGSMGPPQKPVERPEKSERATDINDLSDLVFTSGIDLRQEEELLTHRSQNQSTSFASSFNSQSSSTVSPNSSFHQLSQTLPVTGAISNAGPLSRPPITQERLEDDILKKHNAARALAESHKHLNDPFLNAQSVRQKLHNKANENRVHMDVNGLFEKTPEKPRGVSATTQTGPDDTALVSVKSHSLLRDSATLVDMLSLISIAANERLRDILEDAYALSRGRRLATHGIVPPEYASIAVGDGVSKSTTAIPASLTGTSWDSPKTGGGPMTSVRKESHPSNRLPTPPTDTPPTPQPTVLFSSPIPPALISIARKDRSFEEARIAARKKRRASSAVTPGADSAPGSAAGSAPGTGPSTPAASGSTAPDIKPMTKKERDRLAKQGQTEEVLHRAANQTASMALGGKGKKYAWMSAASSSPSTPRINTAVGGSTAAMAGAGASLGAAPNKIDEGLRARDRRYGDWREDRKGGEGIQLRDLLAALDADGREKRTRARWALKMGVGDK